MMNRHLTYPQWQNALAEPAKKVSDWFEDTLQNHFVAYAGENGGSVTRNPTLSNGSRPDFLIEEEQGRRCYVEAKALFTSRKKSDYFEWRVDLSDIQHPESAGHAHYRFVGAMTQDLSETDKETIRTWLQGLDAGATLSGPWPYHTRTFPCGGAECEINVEFDSDQDSMLWGLFESGPVWRHRIDEKINEILHDPKTGHEKYTREALGHTPLVLATLDLSITYIVHLESEVYGNPFITLDAEGRKMDGGMTGTGIWRDNNGIRSDRTHIGGVWYWDGLPHVTESRERPVLATNPYTPNQPLPESLRAFNRIEWRPTKESRLVADRTDGGHPFDERNLRLVASNYVDECRRALGVI